MFGTPETRWRVASLAAVPLIALGFAFRHQVGPGLHCLEAQVQAAGPFAPLLFALGLGVWGTLCLPGPVMLAAVGTFFASRPLLALAVVLAGDALAQAAAFLIARRLARQGVQSRFGHLGWYQWLEEQTLSRGAAAVFAIRMTPFFPNALASYAFGLTPLAFWPYLAASVAGSALPLGACVLGTAGIVNLVRTPAFRHDLPVALVLALAVSALIYVLGRGGQRAAAGRETDRQPKAFPSA